MFIIEILCKVHSWIFELWFSSLAKILWSLWNHMIVTTGLDGGRWDAFFLWFLLLAHCLSRSISLFLSLAPSHPLQRRIFSFKNSLPRSQANIGSKCLSCCLEITSFTQCGKPSVTGSLGEHNWPCSLGGKNGFTLFLVEQKALANSRSMWLHLWVGIGND